EPSALALDENRHHYNGRAGWDQLRHFVFVEREPGSPVCRLHKTMRDVLRIRVPCEDAQAVHEWFRDHWQQRGETSLAWFHEWSLHPADALDTWAANHSAALKARRIAEARNMLADWAEIPLDDFDREVLGAELWAFTHGT